MVPSFIDPLIIQISFAYDFFPLVDTPQFSIDQLAMLKWQSFKHLISRVYFLFL